MRAASRWASPGGGVFKQLETYGGRTFWFTSYDDKSTTVELGILADSSDSGQWLLIFQDKALRRSFEGSQKVLEKKAL